MLVKPETQERVITDALEAMARWSLPSQIDMVREELTELLLELSRVPRRRHSWTDILEEAVDSYIMIHELFTMYNAEEIEAMFDKKLNKMESKFQ